MPNFDASLLIGLGVGLLAAFLIAWAFRHRGHGATEAGQAQLAGQLQQLAASIQAIQANAQITIETRLAHLGDRVTQRLSESASEAEKSLSDLKERLAAIDAAQKRLTELSGQVVDLQNILSNKQARGAFGEVQLADLVKTIMAPSNYEFQASLGDNRRVDCLLKLPNPPGAIAIDAKFPLESYRALAGAQDEAALNAARRDFTQAIRSHIRSIAEKYIVPGETADGALMFLPSEAVYAELHARFPNLVDEASRARVWIVSPTTLMATLTTMRALLRDVGMREQAHVIQAKAREMVVNIERLDQRVGKLQQHFDQAIEDLRQIRISTDKIRRRGEDIESLEIDHSSETPFIPEKSAPPDAAS